MSNGGIKCWGYGANGRLGYGNATTKYEPAATSVDLDGFTAFQVTTGGAHTCALLSNGGARCWGENGSGQLGYGNTLDIGDTEGASAGGDIQVLAP
jgi:alpha-tubulin suppressor-like RCC1 family protein